MHPQWVESTDPASKVRVRGGVGRSGGWLLTRSGWQKCQRPCERGGFLTFLCASAANPDLAALLQAIFFTSRKGRARGVVKIRGGESAEQEGTTFTLQRTRLDWREPATRRRRRQHVPPEFLRRARRLAAPSIELSSATRDLRSPNRWRWRQTTSGFLEAKKSAGPHVSRCFH